MPAKRELTMRQILQILRWARDGVSAREIGQMLGAPRSMIQDNQKRVEVAWLAWPLPADDVLEDRLFRRPVSPVDSVAVSEPDWSALVCELKRPGINLS